MKRWGTLLNNLYRVLPQSVWYFRRSLSETNLISHFSHFWYIEKSEAHCDHELPLVWHQWPQASASTYWLDTMSTSLQTTIEVRNLAIGPIEISLRWTQSKRYVWSVTTLWQLVLEGRLFSRPLALQTTGLTGLVVSRTPHYVSAINRLAQDKHWLNQWLALPPISHWANCITKYWRTWPNCPTKVLIKDTQCRPSMKGFLLCKRYTSEVRTADIGTDAVLVV